MAKHTVVRFDLKTGEDSLPSAVATVATTSGVLMFKKTVEEQFVWHVSSFFSGGGYWKNVETGEQLSEDDPRAQLLNEHGIAVQREHADRIAQEIKRLSE